MTTRFDALTRPPAGLDFRENTRHRTIGFGLAAIGLVLAMITLLINIAAANSGDPGAALAFSFGLTTTAFGTIKLGIAVVLIGILIRLWWRVESIKTALPGLMLRSEPRSARGEIDTDYGAATETSEIPLPLPVHKMARTMWAPMIGMGYMLVVVGLVISWVWAAGVTDDAHQAALAWTQGVQFLGEGMLLAGIALLLGSILAGLREGGGDVQKSLSLPVQTLKMPTTAKLFVALTALGLMLSVLQSVLYAAAAGVTGAQSFAAWLAWLGPLREFALGSILAGIVLALVTIGNVLGFQFAMVTDFVGSGRREETQS